MGKTATPEAALSGLLLHDIVVKFSLVSFAPLQLAPFAKCGVLESISALERSWYF